MPLPSARWRGLACLAFGFCLLPATSASQAVADVVLKSATVLDVRTGAKQSNVWLVVSHGRITALGQKVVVPAHATVIDMQGRTLLPGLIDTHTHLLLHYSADVGGDDINGLLTLATESDALRALRSVRTASDMLRAGITSVRDLGNGGQHGDLALRDAIAQGLIAGPRMQVATRALSPVGGQATAQVQDVARELAAAEYGEVNGEESARRLVREAVLRGADVIKVIVNTGDRRLNPAELEAIVRESRRAKRRVAAHATDDQSVYEAVIAGVNSVEHAYAVADSTLALMATRGTFLVATDFPDEHFLAFYPDSTARQYQRARVAALVRQRVDRTRRAVAAGVRIAFGSDGYYDIPDRSRGIDALGVLQTYVAAGLTPLQSLQTATINAADLLGIAEHGYGHLRVGAVADLVALQGDPTQDIKLLERIDFVMQGGKVVCNRSCR